MKKIGLLLLLMPLLLATQCEDNCDINVIQKQKANLITVENLQPTYHVGDVIWLTSTLHRDITFENPPETADLYSIGLDYGYNVDFIKTSAYNMDVYISLPANALQISSGSVSNNLFIYEKDGNFLKNRIGIRLLETGNFKISVYNIANFRENGLMCDDTAYSITTSFSNNNTQSVSFTVE